MAVVTIHFYPYSLMSALFQARLKSPATFAEFVTEAIDVYTTSKPVAYSESGVEAAEEAFDITNNPMREEERNHLYSKERSVSVGDVIEVTEADGSTERFLCLDFGWSKI